jgi:hypothetical protein
MISERRNDVITEKERENTVGVVWSDMCRELAIAMSERIANEDWHVFRRRPRWRRFFSRDL